MTSITRTLMLFSAVLLSVLPAQAYERGSVTPAPPVEPLNLFSIPTDGFLQLSRQHGGP